MVDNVNETSERQKWHQRARHSNDFPLTSRPRIGRRLAPPSTRRNGGGLERHGGAWQQTLKMKERRIKVAPGMRGVAGEGAIRRRRRHIYLLMKPIEMHSISSDSLAQRAL